MFDQLLRYRTIGWDFDDTLVNHPKSDLFWQYIRQNPYNQTHYIITMRSGGYEDTIYDELIEHGAELDSRHFVEIISPPNSLWVSHQLAMREGTLQEDHPYHLFKGQQCIRLGVDVLIDDLEKGRLPVVGCTGQGIEHINPDDL